MLECPHMGAANRFVQSARVCLMGPLRRVTWVALFSSVVPFGFANAQGIQALGGTAGAATSVHGRVLNQATRQPIGGALVYSAELTGPSFCTTASERVYITAIGCEIGFDGTRGLQAAGAGGLVPRGECGRRVLS